MAGAVGLTTAQMQVACPAGTTTGICALGDGFVFEAGKYPKVKKCLSNCGIIINLTRRSHLLSVMTWWAARRNSWPIGFKLPSISMFWEIGRPSATATDAPGNVSGCSTATNGYTVSGSL